MKVLNEAVRVPEPPAIARLFPGYDNAFLQGIATTPLCSVVTNGDNADALRRRLLLKYYDDRWAGSVRMLDMRWSDPSTGIEIEVAYAVYPDTGTLEVSGRIWNHGTHPIQGVRGAFPLFFAVDMRDLGTPCMTTVYSGASVDGCYPPPAYRVSWRDLADQGGYTLVGGREGGRSTEQGDMPYAILTDAQSGDGMFMALEWPCRWIMTVSVGNDADAHHSLTCYAHAAWLDLDLQPGESLVMPQAILGFFTGDEVDGSNALRRHVARHVLRPVDGQPLTPPVFYNHYYGFGEWDQRILEREARAYADLGIEYFVVDAGWFQGDFRVGIGNWEIEDARRFPEGMVAFSRYVESLGMKFGSWLEIEYAMRNSDWGHRHRDWFRDAGDAADSCYGKRRYEELNLRLEDPAVRASVADFLETWVERYHISWLRWDFNNAPLAFWQAHETADRVGWLHMGYGEGLLALQDEFMARCPQVHIEACAGGGHRMDLGTLRRAHSAWMNDNSHSYDAIRHFAKGINRILPGCYPGSCFLAMTHAHRLVMPMDEYRQRGYRPAIIRSRMAGSLGFAEQSSCWSERDVSYLKQEIARYKAVRHLLLKDYYPLFAPASLHEYDGWQFHDPDTDEGVVMVFRVRSPQEATTITLRGLTPGREYRLQDMDTGESLILPGDQPLSLPVPQVEGTRWLTYGPC
jgi:alpha-galactosidase